MPETVDTVVFKAADGGGNPCPVTLFADGLTPERMQEMSRASGQEASFVMSPDAPDCDFRVRYFLPLHELSMCMHATIGTSVVLVEKGLARRSPFYFQSERGRVRVDWERDFDGTVNVFVEQFAPEFSEEVPPVGTISGVLGISEDEIAPLPIVNASTSRFKLLVPLVSRAVLDGLSPKWESMWDMCDACNSTGVYAFAIEDGEIYARQFPNRGGYNEDPATGVAASALGAYFVNYGILPVADGWNSIQVKQGFAMGRPSVIRADTRVENGRITSVRVGGTAEIVKAGERA